MSIDPEALARLLNFEKGIVQFVFPDDLRALLDAHATARADGVAAERARVVAWLRAADSETLVWFAAQRIEQGWHNKEPK